MSFVLAITRSRSVRNSRVVKGFTTLGCAVLLVLALAAPAQALVSTGDYGWFWQNPLPQGNDLKGVDFTDAAHTAGRWA